MVSEISPRLYRGLAKFKIKITKVFSLKNTLKSQRFIEIQKIPLFSTTHRIYKYYDIIIKFLDSELLNSLLLAVSI